MDNYRFEFRSKKDTMKKTSDIYPEIQTQQLDINGIILEVDQCGDQESDQLALCLHGFPEHAISWRFQMPMLAELGMKVWAPNLRGYGNSTIPQNLEDYSIETLMADVASLIDASNCSRVTLIAHDWGAMIAWYFAIRRIRNLERLIICNVPHPAAMQSAMGWRQLLRSWYAFFFQIPRLAEWVIGRGDLGNLMLSSSAAPGNFSDEVLQLYRDNGRRPDGLRGMINYYRALIRGGGGRRQRDLGTPLIEVPTLMVWGEDDSALTIETTIDTDQWVSDLTLRYLPRISHWVQQDAPDEVNAMMRAFILGEEVPTMVWESRLVYDDV
mgnify:FL=1